MGSWREVESLSSEYRIMVDGVINHISQFSDWFKSFLAGDKYFEDFFIELDPTIDLSKVVRPRATHFFMNILTNDGKILIFGQLLVKTKLI